jgi:toxin-antitoxin system PIN domain toxin
MTKALSKARPLLLDVHALLALGWSNHPFHDAVLERLERSPSQRWATCLLTELGFVRLSSNPTVVNVRQSPAEAIELLQRLTVNERHLYCDILPKLASVRTTFKPLLGHQQVTDAYLVAVAAANDATLLTLDQRLVSTVVGGDRVEALMPDRVH